METNFLNALAHSSSRRNPVAGDQPRFRPYFSAAAVKDDWPICVDLDGTLIHSDLLIETAFEFIRGSLWALPALMLWALQGCATLKHKLAEASRLNPAHLLYDGRFLDYLRMQRANGCTLILVTASHRLLAEKVAGHLGLFDEVIATEGGRNLKGSAKADELRTRFGVKGFYYTGDARADLPVWRQAKGAILVNASPATRRAAVRAAAVAADFPIEGSPWRALGNYCVPSPPGYTFFVPDEKGPLRRDKLFRPGRPAFDRFRPNKGSEPRSPRTLRPVARPGMWPPTAAHAATSGHTPGARASGGYSARSLRMAPCLAAVAADLPMGQEPARLHSPPGRPSTLGMVHIASYYGVPTTAIFTSGRDSKWAPLGTGSKVVRRSDLSCQPCTLFGQTPPCGAGFACKNVDLDKHQIQSRP